MEYQAIAHDAFMEKYAQPDEDRAEQRQRVARALASVEPKREKHHEAAFMSALEQGFIPGGRIQSGAGTGLDVTLINCFVQPVHDSMTGIADGLRQAMLTLKQGGGVGYDFSPIRPKGALVRAVNAEASGPISFMRVFDRACETIESAGYRRGAQMGVLRIDHPDVREFINEKFTAGSLSNFNVSVGVTDAFMQAVDNDDEFDLVHEAEPSPRLKQLGAFYDEGRGTWVYERVRAREIWDYVMEATYDHADPGVLFLDRMNGENNLWYTETLRATNPCGEEVLPDYGCCCLGSINLVEFVRGAFEQPEFDYQAFAETIATAVRMLDNVLDATGWPLLEQEEEAMNKRRIGLGFMGLGDTLIMLGARYDDSDGRRIAARISECLRDSAYRASIELAKEKGSFPLLDAEQYLDSEFAQRLPEGIREGIRAHGIRNSHLLAIAPTGTIALAFGNNASNGIEPPFAWTYNRNKRMPDDSTQTFEVADYAYECWRRLGNDPGPKNEHLPASFVSALEMGVNDHLQMIAAIQPFIDSAISKTCNVPVDYDYEDFKSLYFRAWKSGTKGLTTFRPNMVTGAVLETTSQGEGSNETPSQFDQSDADRRLSLDKTPQPTLASLRWQRRPQFANGSPSRTYTVDHPGGKFAVFVGYTDNGGTHPFEVWINGAEQPRGVGAIAKSLSMDMRTDDAEWLKAKLDSLSKVHDQSFDLPMPPDGESRRVPSAVSAVGMLVHHCCAELGYFANAGEHTPVIDALMSPKEPKTGPDGTMSWTVDVCNPAMDDDFLLGVKELTLPSGERRPYSVWLSGNYPRALDGLCKALSLDMRVIDPAWIGAKLRKLVDFPEPQGDFMAWVPGEHRQATQPSTVAYIARLMIHRYNMLGILDGEGFPLQPMEVMVRSESNVATPAGAGDNVVAMRSAGAQEATPGSRCDECGNYAVVKQGGCDFCTACGATGACG